MSSTHCTNADDCTLATPVRNRYFNGKLLDARHLEMEQAYGRRQRRLINRLALGSGVLCGLQVAPTNDGSGVAVGPGVALDACGREIVVPTMSPAVSPRQPTDDCGRPSGARITGAGAVLLVLVPHDCEDEPVPVHAGGCCGAEDVACSVVRECYALVVRPDQPLDTVPSCKLPGLFGAGSTPQSVHEALAERISQPPADAGGADTGVVLARIELPATEGDALTAAMIDTTVRPLVASNALLLELLLCLDKEAEAAPPSLTTIEQLSWTHDGQVKLDDFTDPSQGLTLTFSAPLDPNAVPSPRPGWMVVSVEYPVGNSKLKNPLVSSATIQVQRLEGSVKLSADALSITFNPSPQFAETYFDSRKALGAPADSPPLCRVSVLCDMLLDANGKAVDGDFLGGTLPSGNSVAGGRFESWFQLVES
jgi:hypothetical protein